MSVKKIVAISLIFISVTTAWMILGGVNLSRTNDAKDKLKKEVITLYGDNVVIVLPKSYSKKIVYKDKENSKGKIVKVASTEKIYNTLEKSDIKININLDPRKKGNLWFPTFKYSYKSEYIFKAKKIDKKQYIYLQLGEENTIYNNIFLSINGKTINKKSVIAKKEAIEVIPDDNGYINIKFEYESSGLEDLEYIINKYDEISEINNFSLVINTDFEDYDFINSTMSPTTKEKTENGYKLTWELNEAITGKNIGIKIPNKLNPGEIISKVSFFSPIALFFFLIIILTLVLIFKINFHPMHFLLLSATFFSFSLMFSYFSDQMNIYLAFSISAIVSLILTVTYLRFFTPKIVYLVFAPLAQFIYLIVFSFSFFSDGLPGFIVTICSVITLFLIMQITGKLDWNEIFKGNKKILNNDSSESK